MARVFKRNTCECLSYFVWGGINYPLRLLDHLGLAVYRVRAGGAQQALQQQRVVAHELAQLAVRDAAQHARLERVRRVAPRLVAREEPGHAEDLALLVAAHLGGEKEGAGLTEPLLVSR